MNDKKRFASTMLSLSRALRMYGRELTADMQEVYWKALADLTDEDFERAAAVLIRRETEFPPPALFLEIVRPSLSDGEILRLMNRVWFECKEYVPEDGTRWSRTLMLEHFGRAAEEAFMACGGSSGFRLMDDDFHGPGIRRRFREAYQQAVRDDPQSALPQSHTQPALTTGEILARATALEKP